jgi:ClpP class serine protease
VERLKALQGPIHEAFIDHVRRSRGIRLDDSADLFNADIWTGQQSVDLGLADGVAHMVPKLKELYGDKVRLVPFGRKRSLFQRLGLSLADETLGAIEDRALWARYGL